MGPMASIYKHNVLYFLYKLSEEEMRGVFPLCSFPANK